MRNADLAMYRAKAAARAGSSCTRPQMQAGRRTQAPSWPTRLRGRAARRRVRAAAPARGVRWPTAGSRPSPPRRAGAPRRASCSPPPSSCGSPRTADRGPPSSSRWLLEEAVEQAAERGRDGARRSPSPSGCRARRLLDRSLPLGSVEALLTRHGLPSGALVIELADSDPRVSFDELERRLTALRRLGVGSRWTASAAATRRSPRCAASPWTY